MGLIPYGHLVKLDRDPEDHADGEGLLAQITELQQKGGVGCEDTSLVVQLAHWLISYTQDHRVRPKHPALRKMRACKQTPTAQLSQTGPSQGLALPLTRCDNLDRILSDP